MTFADIDPPSANLRGFVGETITEKVWITPRKAYPFSIVSSKAHFGKNIKFKIEKTENWRSTKYLVEIENIKKDKGGYGDTIILTTDSDLKPEIRIPVFGRVLAEQ